MITILFNLLFFFLPFVFFPKTSEVFEFNKIITLYIFTILIISTWLIKMIRSKKIIFTKTKLDIPLLLFILALSISVIFSIDIRTSLLGYYSRWNGGLLSIISFSLLYWAYVTNITKAQTKKIFQTILISATLISIYAILEHFGHSFSCLLISKKFNVSCWIQDVQSRVFATLGQPNWLAAYLVAVLPFTWIIKNRILLYSSTLLLFTATLFTKSRSAFLALTITFLIFIFKTRKKYLLILATSYLIFTAILGLPTHLPASPEQSDGGRGQTLNITPSTQIRTIVWQGATDIWKNNFLVGTGLETFAYSYYQYRPIKHNLTSEWNFIYNKAHNEYINYASTTGTLGLVSYIILIIASIYIFIKNIQYTKYNILHTAILAGYASLLVTNFFGFSTVTTNLFFFLLPAMSTTLSSKQIKYKPKKIKFRQKLETIFVILATIYCILNTVTYWLADYYFANNNPQKAVWLSPNEPLFHAFLANHCAKSDPQKSLKHINIVNKLSPNNIKLQKQVINTYIDLEDFTSAIQSLENLKTLAPTDPQVFYTLGVTYLQTGQTQLGLKNLQKAVFLKPNYEKAIKILNLYNSNHDPKNRKI